MKKTSIILLLILVSILISACKKEVTVEESQHTNEKMEENEKSYADIELEKVDYSIYAEEVVGTYKKDVIPDKETAIAVAVEIYNGMEKSFDAKKYEPQMVSFDEEKEIWIVDFWEEQDPKAEMVTVGGCCSIAIQKKDGQVLRIWFGE